MTRRRATWDVVLSIVLLALALFTAVIDAFVQGVMFVFTDYCPATCHIDQGVNGVLTVWTVMAVILIAGIVVTILLLVTRRRAWWVALIALVGVVAGAIVAYTVYVSAVS
jgi:phosphoglycerol transferase MdoB-like AlkP superfamily enzyme